MGQEHKGKGFCVPSDEIMVAWTLERLVLTGRMLNLLSSDFAGIWLLLFGGALL